MMLAASHEKKQSQRQSQPQPIQRALSGEAGTVRRVSDVLGDEEQPFDPVGEHSRTRHGDLPQYEPNNGKTTRYYNLGVRELDIDVSGSLYNRGFLSRDQHMEHMQFLGDNGKNFGLMKRDWKAELGEDVPENMKRYQ